MQLSNVPTFTVVVNGKQIVIDPTEELVINAQDLTTWLTRHSALLSYWGAVQGFKMEELTRAQDTLKRLQAEKYLEVRKNLSSDPTIYSLPKETKVTESLIDNLVVQDSDVQDAQENIRKAKRDVNVLSALCEGYSANTGILIILGKLQQQELVAMIRNNVRETHSKMSAAEEGGA